jgi:hypothetical protein
MDTVECPNCHKQMVPQVTPGTSGAISRHCPLCGKNMESILNQDVNRIQFKMTPKLGLIVVGVVLTLAIIGFFVINATSKMQ